MKRQNRRPHLVVETLEARDLMTLGLYSVLNQPALVDFRTPALSPIVTYSPDALGQTSVAAQILAAPPVLASNPGAGHTLYLNFAGDSRSQWSNSQGTYRNVVTNPFDTDGNTSILSATERDQITEIWARVAEDYSPFDINVTTVDPGNLDNGKTLMVDIGDSNNWLVDGSGAPQTSSGISSIGSFTDAYPNIVFAFTNHMSGKGDARFVARTADTASHESGHAFGLLHNHLLNADGTLKTAAADGVDGEYDPGFGNRTPIMGDNLTGSRHTWNIGIVGEVGTNAAGQKYDDRQIQVDTMVLGGVLGYRADDFGDDTAHATRLNTVTGTARIKGFIGCAPTCSTRTTATWTSSPSIASVGR
jgi:hypothetical protein